MVASGALRFGRSRKRWIFTTLLIRRFDQANEHEYDMLVGQRRNTVEKQSIAKQNNTILTHHIGASSASFVVLLRRTVTIFDSGRLETVCNAVRTRSCDALRTTLNVARSVEYLAYESSSCFTRMILLYQKYLVCFTEKTDLVKCKQCTGTYDYNLE